MCRAGPARCPDIADTPLSLPNLLVLFNLAPKRQVLEELGDIIDLPMRAEAVDALLAAGDSGLVAAFEGLTVLEGTANNIKEAWRRWVRAL